MLRPRECEHLGAVGAMAVPPEALAAPVTLGEAAAVVCAVCESDGPAAAPHASLETKVYWAMRQAPGVIDSGAWRIDSEAIARAQGSTSSQAGYTP
jgi:hypothetical protein